MGCCQSKEPLSEIWFKANSPINFDINEHALPIGQADINNTEITNVACTGVGEIATGFGLMAELIRWPIEVDRTSWVLSYSVWECADGRTELAWRSYYSDVAALFFPLDASDRKGTEKARDIIRNYALKRELPDFYIIVFCNHAEDPKNMTVGEIGKILELNVIQRCIGTLIQSSKGIDNDGFEYALVWLLEKLNHNHIEAPEHYPPALPIRRRSRPRRLSDAFTRRGRFSSDMDALSQNDG